MVGWGWDINLGRVEQVRPRAIGPLPGHQSACAECFGYVDTLDGIPVTIMVGVAEFVNREVDNLCGERFVRRDETRGGARLPR